MDINEDDSLENQGTVTAFTCIQPVKGISNP